MRIITKRFSTEYNQVTNSHYVVSIINEGARREIIAAGLSFPQALAMQDKFETSEAIGKNRLYRITEKTNGSLPPGTLGQIVGYVNRLVAFSPGGERVEILPVEYLERLGEGSA